MKLIISLVLCYFCANSVNSFHVNQGPSETQVIIQSSDTSAEKGLDTETLIIEGDACALDKLEPLLFEDMFNLAVNSDHCRSQANVIFNKKYASWTINLCGRREITESPKKHQLIIGCGSAELFLSTFASSIDRLLVETTEDPKEIGGLVNEYCAEKLQHLTIKTLKSGIFGKMTKPFEKVERLEYIENSLMEKDNSIKLDQLFPKLSSLQITGFDEATIFNAQYPNLKHLKANWLASPKTTDFLKKNPQIKSIDVQYIDFNLLANIQDNLHQLETLSIGVPSDMHSYKGKPMRFDTVKTFNLSEIGQRLRSGNLIFANLESMALKAFQDVDDKEWMQFLEENKQVKNLTLQGVDASILLTVADYLHDLKQLVIADAKKTITAEIINQIIETNRDLTMVSITSRQGYTDVLVADLQKMLGQQWEIRPLKNTIHMSKKD